MYAASKSNAGYLYKLSSMLLLPMITTDDQVTPFKWSLQIFRNHVPLWVFHTIEACTYYAIRFFSRFNVMVSVVGRFMWSICPISFRVISYELDAVRYYFCLFVNLFMPPYFSPNCVCCNVSCIEIEIDASCSKCNWNMFLSVQLTESMLA